MIRINNIKIYDNLSKKELIDKVLSKYKINKNDFISFNVIKKSIDARDKNNVHFVYNMELELLNEDKYISKMMIKVLPKESMVIEQVDIPAPPIVIGAGPAGLFSALYLVESGVNPIVLEQGECVENRQKTVLDFMEKGLLNPLSNIQFGEGGAGTFSDGKLTTNVNSPYNKYILEQLVRFGAPEEILYMTKPHLGTDNLIAIVKNIREYIISKGGIIRFNTKVIDFEIVDGKVMGVVTNVGNYSCSSVVLAIGHSSHDTFECLEKLGFNMSPKNFSVGVRIEHLQEWINTSQYGNITKLELPSAEYKLAYHNSDRSCYTFCMCPGGVVVASSSDEESVVTNGMSYYSRDGVNANSALLVNITPDDYYVDSVLDGVKYQKELEKKAFILGGSNYKAPVQRVEDFLLGKKSSDLGIVKPTYTPGVVLSDLNTILPTYVSKTLKEGIKYFNSKITNFAHPDAVLTGVETRSSSPVTIVRDELLMSNIKGVYPCGEGAGYAGGIMSAAIDGIKCAIALTNNEK